MKYNLILKDKVHFSLDLAFKQRNCKRTVQKVLPKSSDLLPQLKDFFQLVNLRNPEVIKIKIKKQYTYKIVLVKMHLSRGKWVHPVKNGSMLSLSHDKK